MIDTVFDFEELFVVSPRPLAGDWFGFAGKMKISFCLKDDVVNVERQAEYTDLGGGTQQIIVGYRSTAIGH
jgi:hypothetical protein